MSISHPQFTTRIEGSDALIFDLIADLPNYGRWLPESQAFGETTDVTPYPVRLGTTYVDAGPLGQKPGKVIAYDPPRAIAFHHTMLLDMGPLAANVDMNVRYWLEPHGGATRVVRDLDLTIQMHGPLRVAQPLVAQALRKENVRILAELKRYVEALPKQPDLTVVNMLQVRR